MTTKNEKIKAVLVAPNEEPISIHIDNTLEALQKAVGGYIETVYAHDDNTVIICNEEGKFNGSMPNCVILGGRDIIFGEMLVIGIDEDGEDFRGLTDEECKKYMKIYSLEESKKK